MALSKSVKKKWLETTVSLIETLTDEQAKAQIVLWGTQFENDEDQVDDGEEETDDDDAGDDEDDDAGDEDEEETDDEDEEETDDEDAGDDDDDAGDDDDASDDEEDAGDDEDESDDDEDEDEDEKPAKPLKKQVKAGVKPTKTVASSKTPDYSEMDLEELKAEAAKYKLVVPAAKKSSVFKDNHINMLTKFKSMVKKNKERSLAEVEKMVKKKTGEAISYGRGRKNDDLKKMHAIAALLNAE